jgi:predicted AlkP superfamily phosphohydrolase/phosphomutase
MTARRVASRAAATVLALLACAPRGEPWGSAGHRLVHRKAVTVLPGPIRGLFEANTAYLVEHSIDPDLWRRAGRKEEETSHFLNLDAFGAPSAIPRQEAEQRARHGPQADAAGRLPWRVGEAYRDLVEAFRGKDPALILQRAAVLGHYVGDAHVPLHAVTNHDGQLTGQTGLHARWESDLLERFERQLEPLVRPRPARRVRDPVAFTFDTLQVSFDEAKGVLASDRSCVRNTDVAETEQDDRYDAAYYSRFFELEQGRLLRRLADSATAVASLWLTAWQEAGRPALPPFRFPYVRGEARAVLLSLDGASAPLLDDAVARGVMPHLARLRREGATARGAAPSLPTKTAAAHAALFTGAWSDVNGITANEVPPPDAPLSSAESGFTSTLLRAEPLWVTAARQGLDASVAVATQLVPFEPFLGGRRFGGDFGRSLTLIDGYQSEEAPEAVYGMAQLHPRDAEGWSGALPAHDGPVREVGFEVAGVAVAGLLFDDPSDPIVGFDTLYLSAGKATAGGVFLKPRPAAEDAEAFTALALRGGLRPATVFLRLFALAPDGGQLLLYQSRIQALSSHKPRVTAAAQQAIGGFVGNGANRLYERGAFGPPLWAGGDGTAERRYLETVALVLRQATRLAEFTLDRTRWHLAIAYLPYPDEALHAWSGYLDPSLAGHDAGLALRLRPYVDAVLRQCDEAVGRLREHAGPATIFAVAADHGMVGADRVVRPNVALAQAGLLATDADGRLDLPRTRAVYFPGGFLLINRVARTGGTVRPEDEPQLRRDMVAALRRIVDPTDGRPVVTGILDPHDGHNPGIGGPTGGDLYLSLAAGYDVSPALSGPLVELVSPRGVHFQEPERLEMQAAFALAGPGVARGVELGQIALVDVAPTLAALLGIDPPARATGHVLQKALARR